MSRRRGFLPREPSPEGRGAARARSRAPAPRDLVQLCAFAVGDELYAIDIMRIKEIINPLPITRVPRAPAFVEGVIALRGTILPVIDLRKRFELAPVPPGRASKFLIVAIDAGVGEKAAATPSDRWILGVIVDQVLDVIRLSREDIRATPAVAVDEAARFFSGVCRHRDRIVMLLDLDAILTSSERLGLAGMGQSPGLPGTALSRELEALGSGREAMRVAVRRGAAPSGSPRGDE